MWGELEHKRVYNPKRYDKKGRGKATVAKQRHDYHERNCGEDVSVQTIGLHVILEGEQRQLDSQSQLKTSHNGPRHDASEPRNRTSSGKNQHHYSNREPASVKNLRSDLLGDDQYRDSFQRLNRHRHAVRQRCHILHQSEHHEHARAVQPDSQDHPDNERQVGANIAKRAGQLVSVESNTGRRITCKRPVRFGTIC